MRFREIINLARGFCVFLWRSFKQSYKRLRTLSGNFILLKASLFNKRLLFRARPSYVGRGGEVIWYKAEDNRPTRRAVSAFRRKRKRFAVSKEQIMAVYGMYEPP